MLGERSKEDPYLLERNELHSGLKLKKLTSNATLSLSHSRQQPRRIC